MRKITAFLQLNDKAISLHILNHPFKSAAVTTDKVAPLHFLNDNPNYFAI